jgi:hypothetical protein
MMQMYEAESTSKLSKAKRRPRTMEDPRRATAVAIMTIALDALAIKIDKTRNDMTIDPMIDATKMIIIVMIMTLHAKTARIMTIIVIRNLAILMTEDTPRARTKAERLQQRWLPSPPLGNKEKSS